MKEETKKEDNIVTLLATGSFHSKEILEGCKYVLIKENRFNYELKNSHGEIESYHKSWFVKI